MKANIRGSRGAQHKRPGRAAKQERRQVVLDRFLLRSADKWSERETEEVRTLQKRLSGVRYVAPIEIVEEKANANDA